MSQSDLVVVQSYATEGEAEIAKGVLESSGINAMIQADTAGRMREHLAWSGLGHRGNDAKICCLRRLACNERKRALGLTSKESRFWCRRLKSGCCTGTSPT
jgi:hypothetical protein